MYQHGKTLKRSEKRWEASRMEVYAAMVDIIDQNIGRLLTDLKKRQVLDNTLFLFCADNGGCPLKGPTVEIWSLGSEIYWTYDASWAQVSNTPFDYTNKISTKEEYLHL